MTAINRASLYQYFITNAKPTQSQFDDLIDSFLNLVETSAQSIISDVSALGTLDVNNTFTVKGSSRAIFTGNSDFSGTANFAGALTPLGGIVGTTTNDSATPGEVGEYISSTIAAGAALSLVTNTAKNITSISLTAGDWDVWGIVEFNGNASTAVNMISGKIATTNTDVADTPTGGFGQAIVPSYAIYNLAQPYTITLPTLRVSIAGTTPYYLNALSLFGTSTSATYGGIFARRVR